MPATKKKAQVKDNGTHPRKAGTPAKLGRKSPREETGLTEAGPEKTESQASANAKRYRMTTLENGEVDGVRSYMLFSEETNSISPSAPDEEKRKSINGDN